MDSHIATHTGIKKKHKKIPFLNVEKATIQIQQKMLTYGVVNLKRVKLIELRHRVMLFWKNLAMQSLKT